MLFRCGDLRQYAGHTCRCVMFEQMKDNCFAAVLILAVAVSAGYAGEVVSGPNEPGDLLEAAGGTPRDGYHFTVDESQSQITVSATILNQTDSNSAPVAGRLRVWLLPGQGPFTQMHIRDMELDLTEQIDLSYSWLLLGDGWLTGTDVGIDMNQPGPVSTVEMDDSFVQPQNLLTLRGTIAYNMPIGDPREGEVDLSTMDPIESGLAGHVWQDWTTIRFQLDVDIEYPIVVGETDFGTARIYGTVVASADLLWAVADIYDDGIINFLDFAVLASVWHSTSGDGIYNGDFDISNPVDGVINALDLEVLAYYWLEQLTL